MFELQIVFGVFALTAVLAGIWYEDKIIAFEDRVWDFVADRIGYIAARIVIAFRRKKVAKLRAERNARANEIAAARRSRIHIVKDNTSAESRATDKYIA